MLKTKTKYNFSFLFHVTPVPAVFERNSPVVMIKNIEKN